MISDLINHSNFIDVRINDLNNTTTRNEFDGATKINLVDGKWVWKVSFDSDYVVNSNNSVLVSRSRSNGSPFGTPFLEGETIHAYYSVDKGDTWTELEPLRPLPEEDHHVNINNSGFIVGFNDDNASIVSLAFNNPELIGNLQVVFKIEMTYSSGATAPANYAGPEYFVFEIQGNPPEPIDRGFIDTESQTLFDGHAPYVHWFPGKGQSVGLNYAMTLWYVSDKLSIDVSLDENDVFKLLDASKFTNPSNLGDLNACLAEDGQLTLTSTYDEEHEAYINEINGSYVYPIYLCAKTDNPGQYTHPITIDGEDYIIGIDAYMENENVYINLANMGVEIPDSVQKALYTNNVREEKKDNILLNRKFKELVSQYWDTLAGRGSYKSLINSLEWFEWGDGVRLREIWSRANELGLNLMNDRELSALLKEEYKNTLTTFKKTTYMSIYHSLEKPVVVDNEYVYDDQKNPVMDYTRDLWSKEDLSMKLAMLGAFYETYFMPIHLELLHCTIEDVVFTNTFKEVFGAGHGRRDNVYNSCEIECNVKDGDNFYLHNTRTQTNPSTLFGWDWNREHAALSDEMAYDWWLEYFDNDKDALEEYLATEEGKAVFNQTKALWDLAGLEQHTDDVIEKKEDDLVIRELKKRTRGLYKEVEVIGVEDEATANDLGDFTSFDGEENANVVYNTEIMKFCSYSGDDQFARLRAITGDISVGYRSLLNVGLEGLRSIGFNIWSGPSTFTGTGGNISITDEEAIKSIKRILHLILDGAKIYFNFRKISGGVTGSIRGRHGTTTIGAYFQPGKIHTKANNTSSGYVGNMTSGLTHADIETIDNILFVGGSSDYEIRDFCFNISDPNKNGMYEKYQDDFVDLSWSQQYFPAGLKFKDELTISSDGSGTLTFQTKTLNLGSLEWTQVNDPWGYRAFRAVAPSDMATSYLRLHFSRNSIWLQANYASSYEDKRAKVYNGYIYMLDTAQTYANASAFQTAINGEMMDYNTKSAISTVNVHVPDTLYKLYSGGVQILEPFIDDTEEMFKRQDVEVYYGAKGNEVASEYVYSQDTALKNFWAQYFNGVGTVVPFELKMNVPTEDSLKEERLIISKYDDEGKLIKTSTRTSNRAYEAVENEDGTYTITVPFKLLFTEDASWQLQFELTAVSGLNSVKIVNINTLDLGNATIKVCRVRPNDPAKTYDNDVTDYMMQRQPFLPQTDALEERGELPYDVDEAFCKQYTYTQFIPYYKDSNKSIKKNHILVFDVREDDSQNINIINFLNNYDYNIFFRKETDEDGIVSAKVNFIVGVSKWFDGQIVEYRLSGAEEYKYNTFIENYFDYLNTAINQYVSNQFNNTVYNIIDDENKTNAEKTKELEQYEEYCDVPEHPEYIPWWETAWEFPKDNAALEKYTEKYIDPKDIEHIKIEYRNDAEESIESTLNNDIAIFEDYIYRNDTGFFGQFHHLEPITEDESNDPITGFFITQDEVLCVVPDIKFAHDITTSEWEFKNVSKNKSYIVKSNDNEHTISAQTPFVAPNKGMLEPGYYDVIFRYKIKSSDNTVRTLRRNSAFKLLKK